MPKSSDDLRSHVLSAAAKAGIAIPPSQVDDVAGHLGDLLEQAEKFMQRDSRNNPPRS